MHGNGELLMKEGDIIRTTWVNGKKNGKGTITNKDGKVFDVQYYNDLEIKLADQNPDCYDKSVLNMILCLLALICMGCGVVFSPYFFIGAVSLYII